MFRVRLYYVSDLGRSDRTRTCGPLPPRQVRYRLRHTPERVPSPAQGLARGHPYPNPPGERAGRIGNAGRGLVTSPVSSTFVYLCDERIRRLCCRAGALGVRTCVASEWRGSNPRPPRPERGALPAALHSVCVREPRSICWSRFAVPPSDGMLSARTRPPYASLITRVTHALPRRPGPANEESCSTHPGIRTPNLPALNRTPLPIGLRGRVVAEQRVRDSNPRASFETTRLAVEHDRPLCQPALCVPQAGFEPATLRLEGSCSVL